MSRPVSALRRLVLVSIFTLAGAGGARAEVLFQNPGNTKGWDRLFTQKAGTINEVSSPVYKGTTAVKTTQTYQTSDAKNYHSEIIKAKAHLAGQDLYYGHAVYLPADWVFHSQNVTFQQWAPEQPEAPWVLMYLQGDRLRLGGRGAMGDKDAGRVTGLRGTWIRFVTRIHMATDGVFEVWINGEKTFSQRGNWRAHGPSMRWSNGIYCTRWDTETPTGPRELTFFHDNMRIATTYAEADPATWSDGDGPPQPDGGAAEPDAATGMDMGKPAVMDAGGAGGGGGSGDSGGSGGASGMGGGGATGGAGGSTAGGSGGSSGPPGGGSRGGGGRTGSDGAAGSGAPSSAGPSRSGGLGCRFGGSDAPATHGWAVLVLAALLLMRRSSPRLWR
jgi:uncharacterized membrane protein YgcG